MSESLDPTDLLDEHGNVDQTKIRSISNRGNSHRPSVEPSTCAEWREEAVGAPNAKTVSEHTDHAKDTVRRHISGECECVHDTPALEYDRSYADDASGSSGIWRLDT